MYSAKEFSKLTKISIRTLNYYAAIKLLKPYQCKINNIPLYSAMDILKLQQIVALKFIGFQVHQIKQLLQENTTSYKDSNQQKQKVVYLHKPTQPLLERFSHNLEYGKAIQLERVIKLREIFYMAQVEQDLKKIWGDSIIHTDKEIRQFSELSKMAKQIDGYNQHWEKLIQRVRAYLNEDNQSENLSVCAD